MATVGFVSHPDFLKHDTSPSHPERPDRLRAIQARLSATGLIQTIKALAPRQAENSWLEAAHTPEHIKNVQTRCKQGLLQMEDPETLLCPASYDVARLAAGAALVAVDTVMENEADAVFCASRPPGHHCERDQAMGFCLFNTAAIAARYTQREYSIDRVLILDWDVHHGNGTQHILEEDPSVFYVSLHQYPHYPGTGHSSETGIGPGQGATLNVLMDAGSGDDDYLSVFDSQILPAIGSFNPDFIVVSAGFDAHHADPLSATSVTESGFSEMTKRIWSMAKTHANGRLISILEGGYDLEGLSGSVESHLQTLVDA